MPLASRPALRGLCAIAALLLAAAPSAAAGQTLRPLVNSTLAAPRITGLAVDQLTVATLALSEDPADRTTELTGSFAAAARFARDSLEQLLAALTTYSKEPALVLAALQGESTGPIVERYRHAMAAAIALERKELQKVVEELKDDPASQASVEGDAAYIRSQLSRTERITIALTADGTIRQALEKPAEDGAGTGSAGTGSLGVGVTWPGGWRLTQETARLLALWMSYEDVIRVADLKTRASRFARVRKEAAAKDDQIVVVTDYLKPSASESADILPPAWAARLRRNAGAGRAVKLRTSDVSGFLAMRLMAALKPLRRRSSRFLEEQALIERWLGAIKRLGFAVMDAELSLEIVQCARLVRGYGETWRQSRAAFVKILDTLVENEQAVARGADALKLAIRKAREAALVYEEAKPAPAARGKPVIWMKSG